MAGLMSFLGLWSNVVLLINSKSSLPVAAQAKLAHRPLVEPVDVCFAEIFFFGGNFSDFKNCFIEYPLQTFKMWFLPYLGIGEILIFGLWDVTIRIANIF